MIICGVLVLMVLLWCVIRYRRDRRVDLSKNIESDMHHPSYNEYFNPSLTSVGDVLVVEGMQSSSRRRDSLYYDEVTL